MRLAKKYMVKIELLFLVSIVIVVVPVFFEVDAQALAYAECVDAGMVADLNGDCRVDFEDFAIFASQWLGCTAINGCI